MKCDSLTFTTTLTVSMAYQRCQRESLARHVHARRSSGPDADGLVHRGAEEASAGDGHVCDIGRVPAENLQCTRMCLGVALCVLALAHLHALFCSLTHRQAKGETHVQSVDEGCARVH